ncbi:GAF domain-containing protein [Elioraea sp. Yellowstone]|jgi:adenylate cyclase|uniref:cache domain-containing protein n=1 Tax=Elioraea sp. Yellowstone TaxID=2592070 RepID=UPI0011526E44|nr:cache domain-containing protein [Elioraea sp. Yellowstone]TQF81659.1 GAF domain-containing protein [Elioraea sp. Yellowstone]
MTPGAAPDRAEVIDLSRDPREARAEIRRRLARVVLPVLAAMLLIGATLGTIAVSHVNSRDDALALADAVLQALERRIVTEIENWLSPAERSVRLLHEAERRGAFRDDMRLAEPVGMALLSSIPHVAIVSIADADGSYLMFRRNEAGGIDTKIITQRPARRVVNIIRSADGSVVRTFEDPVDPFDPRTRPWFVGAAASRDVYWTEIYVFFTDRVPGLTVSVAMREETGELRGVFGADIRLDALSAFLAGLTIGRTGRAMIIDRRGTLVAFPEADRTIKQVGDRLAPVRLDELNDPVLTRAFDIVRVEGPGRRTIEVAGTRHLTIATTVPGLAAQGWLVLIAVPEDEFIGFVARNTRLALVAAAAVAALAMLLAFMLVRQGLRADRTLRRLGARNRTAAIQAEALAALAAHATIAEPHPDDALQRFTETVARTLEARRVGVWCLGAGQATLRCEDAYDAEGEAHVAGTRLAREEIPEALAVLVGGTLDLADAGAEPRLAELHRRYLQPLGSRALLSAPIRRGEETLGLLWVEDRAAGIDGAAAFATAAAALLAPRLAPAIAGRSLGRGEPIRLAAGTAGVQRSDAALMPGDGSLGGERVRRLAQRLARRGLDEHGVPAALFRDVTVLVLRFTDPLLLGGRATDPDGTSLAAAAVRILEEVAARHGIDYLRLCGETAVAADGFGADSAARAAAMAEAALDLQELISALFHAADQRQGFRIGLDTGPAMGDAVGAARGTYNLWGEAVRTAETMAASAPEAAIQASATTSALIADRFLLRPRGRFWLDGTGEVATFLLMARA